MAGQKHPTIYKGATFATFQEFDDGLKAYSREQCVPYVVDGSTLIEKYNKENSTDLPSNLKYGRAKFVCKHGGPPRRTGKGLRVNQPTFKMKCPALIIINVNKVSRQLEVTKVQDEHVHKGEIEPEDINKYPEFRRKNLDPKLLEETENLLKLNIRCDVLRDYLDTVKGKALSIQDLYNIRAKMRKDERGGRSESEEFMDELENLLQSSPGSKVKIGLLDEGSCAESETESVEGDGNAVDKETHLEYVYFHTAEMGHDFEKFSDVLVADSTYCTNKYDMPLMVFLCIDSNGNGRVAGYCLMKDECQSTVKKAVEAFCDSHDGAKDNIKTVLVDKDYNERTVIAEIFPDAVIHICLFHTLQIFKRNTKTEPKRDDLRALLEKIAYSPTIEVYNELYAQLPDVASPTFVDYFNNNWHNCREVWTLHERDMSINNGQTTTNIAESHHQKIKALLKRFATLVELLRRLLLLHSNKKYAVSLRTFNAKVKVQFITSNDDPVVDLIINSTSPFVGSLLQVQYNWAMEKASIADALPDDFDYSKCSCRFYKGFGLPCSHIFLGRLKNGLEIFVEDLIPHRWKPEHCQDLLPIDCESVVTVSRNPLKVGGRPLAENQRYKLVMETTSKITELVKSCGGNQFTNRLNAMKKIVRLWENRKEIEVREAGIATCIIDGENSVAGSVESEVVHLDDAYVVGTEPVEVQEVVHAESVGQSCREQPASGDTRQRGKVASVEQYKILDPKVRSTVVLPKGHVPKGRPKTKERLSAIGRKKKAPTQTSQTCDQPGSMPSCKCTGNVTAQKLKCSNNGPNHGKHFLMCPKGRKGGCGFFQWLEPPQGPGVLCNCHEDCIIRQTAKGECYYTCWKYKCGFVQWFNSSQDTQEVIILGDSSDEEPGSDVVKTEMIEILEAASETYADEDMGFSDSLGNEQENKEARNLLGPETSDETLFDIPQTHRESVRNVSAEVGQRCTDLCKDKGKRVLMSSAVVNVQSSKTYKCFGCSHPLSKRTSTKPHSKGMDFYGCDKLENERCKSFAFWAPGSKKQSQPPKGIGQVIEIGVTKVIGLAEVNQCQQYLHAKFPNLVGLKPCVKVLTEQQYHEYFDIIEHDKNYIQILNDGADGYFVFVLMQGSSTPLLFDFAKRMHSTLPSFIETQVALIMKTSEDFVTFRRPLCQQITNKSGAPQLAVAVATNVAHAEDEFLFDIEEVKSHALECLRQKAIIVFPNTATPPKRSRKEICEEYFEVFCKCRLPQHYDDMIVCDNCSVPFHLKCVNIPATWTDGDPWWCEACAGAALDEILNDIH